MRLQSALPNVADPISIDGTPQEGFAGMPTIEIDGSTAGDADGLRLTGGSSTVRGLSISGFARSGILIEGFGDNTVVDNAIGPNGGWGIAVADSAENRIGGIRRRPGKVNTGNQSGGFLMED